MKNRLTFLCVLLSLTACLAQNTLKEKSKVPFGLEPLWETDALFPGVESVLYDPESEFIYAANINGNYLKKDGNGFISKLDVNGKIVDLQWVKGLDGPTGLGIYAGKLYTTDIDRIIEIDLKTAKVLNSYEVEGAKAFNDVAVAPDGTIYCSDTEGNQIFALKNGEVTKIMANIDTPNGLLVDKGRFLVACWNSKTLNFLNLKTKALEKLADGLTWPDGIEAVGDGGYFVSGLKGVIHYIDAKRNQTVLLDRSAEKLQAADIDFVLSKNLLLVPGLNSNKIMAYQLKHHK